MRAGSGPIRSGPIRLAAIAIFLAAAGAMALTAAPPAQAQPAAPGAPVEEGTELIPDAPHLSASQEELAQKIFGELISPCCWTTTVAVHGSGAAPRIQAEVRQMIAGGMTHQQILDKYVKQYGERILSEPKKKGFNLAAYWVPYLALILGGGAIATTFRRRKRAAAAASATGNGPTPASAAAAHPVATGPDAEYHRRIEEELRRSS